MKHDLETFLLFSLARELAPFRLQEHVLKPPSLEAFYYFPGILTDFNSLPPASLSLLLLHFNCDFHGYVTLSTQSLNRQSTDSNKSVVGEPTTTTTVRAMNKDLICSKLTRALRPCLIQTEVTFQLRRT